MCRFCVGGRYAAYHPAGETSGAAHGGADASAMPSWSGEDGRKKLAQAWRVGEDDEGSGREGLVLPVDRGTLSMALGRENAVHLALTDARAADRVLAHLSRWQFFTGWSRDAADRVSSTDSRDAGTGDTSAASAVSDAF